MGEEFSKTCNEEALRHLLRMEAAVIVAHRAGVAATPMQRCEIGNEALQATALMSMPYTWRSRPVALAMVAEQARILNGRREITHDDVESMMKAIEESWSLDPDVHLTKIPGEEREAFDLCMEDLSERAGR